MKCVPTCSLISDTVSRFEISLFKTGFVLKKCMQIADRCHPHTGTLKIASTDALRPHKSRSEFPFTLRPGLLQPLRAQNLCDHFHPLALRALLIPPAPTLFRLADGTSLTGDIVSFDDIGVKFRLADGTYSERVSWTKFSQDGLKQLANNPKNQAARRSVHRNSAVRTSAKT